MILHISPREKWEEAKVVRIYSADTLSSQGFIHCSTPEQVIDVANHVFKGQSDLLILLIDEDKVINEIKFEDPGNGKLYPHIYGPLNIDAVIDIREFHSGLDGKFELPNLVE